MYWDHLKQVGDRLPRPPQVAADHWQRLCDVGREVESRTGAKLWINMDSVELVFGYSRPSGGIALVGHPDMPLYRKGTLDVPTVFDPSVDKFGVDDVCYLIQLGKADPVLKDRWATARSRAHKADQAERQGQFMEEVFRTAANEARHRVKRARLETRTSKIREWLTKGGIR